MNRTEIKDALRQFQANGSIIPKLSLKTEVLAAALAELNAIEVVAPDVEPIVLSGVSQGLLEISGAGKITTTVPEEVSSSPFRPEAGLKALADEFSYVNKYVAPLASFALLVALQFAWVAFLIISRADIPLKVQRVTEKLLEIIKELAIEAHGLVQVIWGLNQLLP